MSSQQFVAGGLPAVFEQVRKKQQSCFDIGIARSEQFGQEDTTKQLTSITNIIDLSDCKAWRDAEGGVNLFFEGADLADQHILAGAHPKARYKYALTWHNLVRLAVKLAKQPLTFDENSAVLVEVKHVSSASSRPEPLSSLSCREVIDGLHHAGILQNPASQIKTLQLSRETDDPSVLVSIKPCPALPR